MIGLRFYEPLCVPYEVVSGRRGVVYVTTSEKHERAKRRRIAKIRGKILRYLGGTFTEVLPR